MGKEVNYDKVTLIYEPEHAQRREQNRLLLQLSAVFLISFSLFTCLFIIFWMQTANQLELENADCKPAKFDFLRFTLRWPATFCHFEICPTVYPQKWNIHGLWPDYNDGTYPQYCCPSDKFDVKKLSTLIDRMNAVWFNLERRSNGEQFWEHEWSKHGTCCSSDEKLNDEFKYFNSTLGLYSQYPVEQWLNDANIRPTSTVEYSMSQIKALIKNKFGKEADFQCDNHKRYEKAHALLFTIELCFDKQLQPIDCPKTNKGMKCPEKIIYPKNKEDFAHKPVSYEVDKQKTSKPQQH